VAECRNHPDFGVTASQQALHGFPIKAEDVNRGLAQLPFCSNHFRKGDIGFREASSLRWKD
jgi:hypothetical protein